MSVNITGYTIYIRPPNMVDVRDNVAVVDSYGSPLRYVAKVEMDHDRRTAVVELETPNGESRRIDFCDVRFINVPIDGVMPGEAGWEFVP